MRLLSAWVVGLSVVLLTAVLLHNVCDLFYDCGCTWLWAGGDAHCNIHEANGPHCPWCANGLGGLVTVLGLTTLAEMLGAWGPRRPFWARLVGSVFAGALTLLALGILFALHDGYPTFLGFALAGG